MKNRKPRKVVKGVVISNKMDKTAVVKVERKIKHPKYNKLVARSRKCYAHDEGNLAQIGQEVLLMETRPLSKLKKYRIIQGK